MTSADLSQAIAVRKARAGLTCFIKIPEIQYNDRAFSVKSINAARPALLQNERRQDQNFIFAYCDREEARLAS